MKKMIGTLILAGVLSAGGVLAQDRSQPGGSPPSALREQFQQLELRNHALDVEAHAEKLRFEQEMNNLKIKQHRLAIDLQEQAGSKQGPTTPEHWHRRAHGCVGFLLLLCGVIHILLTVWVYQDIKQRNQGSGIWIVITLLTGLCGTAVYALVRLGEKQDSKAP
jgi:hypothetical protein